MTETAHVPVLASDVLALLAPQPGEVVVDCTLGRGGHAVRLAEAVGPEGRLIGFDLDPENLGAVRARLADATARIELIRDSFVTAPARLTAMELAADVVLADLGFSSSQMDDPERGFSFRYDGPLDMRLDPDGSRTAADLLATEDEAEIADIIFHLGEEPLARKIARKVVEARARGPIQTTSDLVGIVLAAYGARARRSRMHPATRTFMALRIAINDELEALDALLAAVATGAGGDAWLRPGARVGIISFHSLEDRRVKRAFADLAAGGRAERVTKKPVVASPDEIRSNPRSRSAKLRVLRIAERTTSTDGPSQDG